MANTNEVTQTSASKSMVVGGIWRSRRIVAVAALAGAMSFGFIGSQVDQAGATIGWCRANCRSTNTAVPVSHSLKAPAPYTIGWCRGPCYQANVATK